jgi:hypothetical protein
MTRSFLLPINALPITYRRRLNEVLFSGKGYGLTHVKVPPKDSVIKSDEEGKPGRLFYHVSERVICPNMKLTTLEKFSGLLRI